MAEVIAPLLMVGHVLHVDACRVARVRRAAHNTPLIVAPAASPPYDIDVTVGKGLDLIVGGLAVFRRPLQPDAVGEVVGIGNDVTSGL